MRKIVLAVLGLTLLALSSAYAIEGNFSGVVLTQYQNTPASGANSFDVTRAYLTYLAKLPGNVKMRYTTDLTRSLGNNVTTGALTLFAKYAWLEISEVPQLLNGKLRFGLIETPWIGFEDGIWGYRIQGSDFVDRWGLVSSADFGVSLAGNLGPLEYDGAIINGAGYKSAENNRSKRSELRLTSKPMKNVLVSAFTSQDYLNDNVNTLRQLYIGQVAYKDHDYTLAGDYLVGTSLSTANVNTSGYSIFGTVRLGMILDWLKGYTFIGRMDQRDPNTSAANDELTIYIAGISYELIKGTLILLDVERQRGTTNTTTAYGHIQVKF